MKTLYLGAAFIIVFTSLAYQGCRREEPLSKVRIVVPPFYSSSLIFIAKDKNFFKDAGLELELAILPYGKDCLEEMLENKYDFSAVYVTPLAKSIRDHKKVSILTELHKSGNNTKLIYRKDLITVPADQLSGFKIGLVKNTNAEFLLSLFFAVNSIEPNANTIINTDEEELESQLLDGKIQGAVFWQPRVSKLLNNYPEKLSYMDTPFYTDFSVLVGNSKFVDENEKITFKVLKALVEAKNFFDNQPTEARKIISKYLIDKSILENKEVMQEFSIELGLSQMFKVMLKSEVNWSKKIFLKERFSVEDEPIIKSSFIRFYLPEKVTLQ